MLPAGRASQRLAQQSLEGWNGGSEMFAKPRQSFYASDGGTVISASDNGRGIRVNEVRRRELSCCDSPHQGRPSNLRRPSEQLHVTLQALAGRFSLNPSKLLR